MTIAANLGGQRRQFDRYGVVRWRQFGSNHLHLRLIMIYQRALHLALFCIAENVNGSATQSLETGQQCERFAHPWPELALEQVAGLRISFCEERRRKIIAQLRAVFATILQLLSERRIGMQTRRSEERRVGKECV